MTDFITINHITELKEGDNVKCSVRFESLKYYDDNYDSSGVIIKLGETFTSTYVMNRDNEKVVLSTYDPDTRGVYVFIMKQ
jgi:hypothetical protein